MSEPVPGAVKAAELPAVQTFLATQNRHGGTAPAFTAPGVLALMAQLDTLSSVYPTLQNATVRGWADLLYDDLIKVTTVHKQPFPGLYVAYHLATFLFAPDREPSSMTLNRASGSHLLFERPVMAVKLEYSMTAAPTGIQVMASNQTFPVAQYGVCPAFRQTCTLLYDQVVTATITGTMTGGKYSKTADEGTAQGSITRSPWGGPPAAPPHWNQALTALLTTWAMQPPAAVIPLTTFDNRANVQGANLDPANWTDVEQVKAGVAPVWAAQTAQLRALLQPPTLIAGGYFFLLHLLVGLLTGDRGLAGLPQRHLQQPARLPGADVPRGPAGCLRLGQRAAPAGPGGDRRPGGERGPGGTRDPDQPGQAPEAALHRFVVPARGPLLPEHRLQPARDRHPLRPRQGPRRARGDLARRQMSRGGRPRRNAGQDPGTPLAGEWAMREMSSGRTEVPW